MERAEALDCLKVQTEKGRDLLPVLGALIRWGDKYYAPNGPPRLLLHRGCGGDVISKQCCATCGQELTSQDIESRLGPGARRVDQLPATPPAR